MKLISIICIAALIYLAILFYIVLAIPYLINQDEEEKTCLEQ
jgi:hypothetical protein